MSRYDNRNVFLIVFKILSPGPPPYPILWPTLAQYGLTIVRVVIGQSNINDFFSQLLKTSSDVHPSVYTSIPNLGGIVGIATRAVFKPTSYLTVCKILQVTFATNFQGNPLHSQHMFATNFHITFLQQTFTTNCCNNFFPTNF